MCYEYKELIEQAIIDDDRPLDWEEGFNELDEVYAKAQAFDEIMKLLDKHTTFIEDYHTNWDSFSEELIESGLIEL